MSVVYVKWSRRVDDEVVLEARICPVSWTNEDRPGCYNRLTACHTTDLFEMDGNEFTCEIDEADKIELMKKPDYPKGFKFFYTEELARYSKGCYGGRYLIGNETTVELFDPDGRRSTVTREFTDGRIQIEEYVDGVISSQSNLRNGRYFGDQIIYFLPENKDDNEEPLCKKTIERYDDAGERIQTTEYFRKGPVKTRQTKNLSVFYEDESGFPSVIMTNDENMLTDFSNSTIYYFEEGRLTRVDVIRNPTQQFLKRLKLLFLRSSMQRTLLRKVAGLQLGR